MHVLSLFEIILHSLEFLKKTIWNIKKGKKFIRILEITNTKNSKKFISYYLSKILQRNKEYSVSNKYMKLISDFKELA